MRKPKNTDRATADRQAVLDARQYDTEFRAMDAARPLTAAQRARWARVKRGVGRPKIGQGAKVIALSIERGLLAEADRFAAAQKLTRAQLVAQALRTVIRKSA